MKNILNDFKKLNIFKKIISIIYIVVYFVLFVQKLFIVDGTVHFELIIIPTILTIITLYIFIKEYKVPEKYNSIASIIMSGVVIAGNYILLQYSQGYQIFSIRLKLIAFNLFVIATIFMFIYALFNSFKIAMMGLCIITTVFGLGNYFVVQFRGFAILAADITNIETAGNVASGYSYVLSYGTYILLLSCVSTCMLTGILDKNQLFKGFKRVIPIIVSLSMIFVGYQNIFASDKYNQLIFVNYFRPQDSFSEKGMYINFLKSLKDIIVNPPEDYSTDVVKKLLDGTKTNSKLKSKKPNIIMVMDEAFTDFSSMTDLKITEDYLPYYHSLNDNTVKGNMFVSIFGGSTASTEFEALTSNSMAFIPNGLIAYSTYINEPMASLASVLKEQGYGTALAMHPFRANSYKRFKVYPLLGFDKYITEADFPEDVDREGWYISDKADFNRIISEYEDYKKNNDKPFFMFNVTMQNHSPFTAENVEDRIQLKYKENYPEADQYVDMLKATDDSLKMLVNYFKKIDEPTMIVFFGDHQPKVEDGFYEQVRSDINLKKRYKALQAYYTQFMIWTNYDIEEQSNVHLSANYMSSLVLDTAGLRKSEYQTFVSELRDKVPVITRYGYVGDNKKYYSIGDTSSPYYDLVKKYNIVEYNNVFDVKNRYEKAYTIE